MTSDDIEFVVMLSSHKTLAEVARTLNVTPPSVTQRLQNIERKLEIKIIKRPSRMLSLTEEGRLIVDKGAPILQNINDLSDLLQNAKNTLSGRLRVLAPLGFGNDFVAPLLSDYKKMYPQLDIELELSDRPEWSTNHRWDVIIYIGQLNNSSLKMITLAPNQRFVCASPSYIEQYGKPLSPADLSKHHCISLRENKEDNTLWQFTAKNGSEQIIRINPSFESNEGRVVKDWGLAGNGIIMRSEWDVQPEINSGNLVRLLEDYTMPSANIVALSSSPATARSARVAGFIDLLKDVVGQQPWLSAGLK